ncbi:MAG TPA: YdeI/OmpD-associated family protein [Bacteroidota bacterium]|nr:YdeI/OmpD-associated family protein [Bacteroidota bacterium]
MPRHRTQKSPISPLFFPTPSDFRRWLSKNHAKVPELWVGFYKRETGKPSITWPESVDQALCFGWIDGVRKSLGREAYVIRFTPRKPTSLWSVVNIRRAKEMIRLGLMRPEGKKAFDLCDAKKTNRYSFERERVRFTAPFDKVFRANKGAWNFFQSQPPGYRKTATWWVMSAKQEETQRRRLETLIADSAAGQRIGLLRRS